MAALRYLELRSQKYLYATTTTAACLLTINRGGVTGLVDAPQSHVERATGGTQIGREEQ